MRNASSSQRPFPSCVPLLAACLLAVAPAAAPGTASEPGEPFLVRDIDTTREPYIQECDFVCPPPTPVFGSLIDQLTPLGDRLVFIANDRFHGFEPWVSDGTTEGTRLLADTGEYGPHLLGVIGDRLYFWVYPAGPEDSPLWVTDGTPEGTRRLDELCPKLCDDGLFVGEPSVAFEGSLFIQLYHPLPEGAHVLWRTDGTPEGTARVLSACDASGDCFNRFGGYFEHRGRLYFNDPQSLRRLGRPTGIPRVAWSQTPSSAATLGKRLILGLDASIPSVWVMHRPRAEPRLLAHVGGTAVSQLTSIGGFVYFVVDFGDRQELWRTDGTAGGTGPNPFSLRGLAVDIVGVLDGGPVVRVYPEPSPLPVVPYTLWRLDPAGGPQEALSYRPVQSLAVAGDRIFFSAEDELGRELWVSDGTTEGTRLLADIAPGPASSEPGLGGLRVPGFAAAGDRLFFPAHHPDTDIELWALELNTAAAGAEIRLEGATPGSSELPGLFDRTGFEPE